HTRPPGRPPNAPAYVARLQSLIRQIRGQNNGLQFLDHRSTPRMAYAITNLGGFSPVATNQIARIRGFRPSGASSGPSTIYLVPNWVSATATTRAARACRTKASRKVSHAVA